MAAHESVRQALVERLAALQSRIDRIEAEMAQPLDADFAEQAVARQDDEAEDAVETAALAEIVAIRAALGRIADGTYGACVSCGTPIAPARLEALPTALTCIACASGG